MNGIASRLRGRTARIMALAVVPLALVGFVGSHVAHASDSGDTSGQHVSWLSGLGDDANPCSRTAPCKTVQGAFIKTAQPDGEITTEDPGSYGNSSAYLTPFTINGGIDIDGGANPIVMQNTVSGIDGIDIAAAPTDVVVLRHVDLQGFGMGLHGINFISGKALYIEDSTIEDFTGDGVHIAPTAGGRVVIENSTIEHNGQNGVDATGASPTALATVTVKSSTIDGNAAAGVLAADYSDVTVDGNDVTGNAQGLACVTQSTGSCVMTASANTVAQSTTGILSGRGVPGATANATVYLTGNTISGNARALSFTPVPSFGRIISLGDNTLVDNKVVGKISSTITKM